MRRYAGHLVALGATAGGAALFARQVSWSDTRGLLAGIPSGTAATAVAAVLGGIGFTALRWRYLLRAAGIEARVPRLFAGLAAGAAVNNVVPARGGDVVRVRSVPARASASSGRSPRSGCWTGSCSRSSSRSARPSRGRCRCSARAPR